MVLAHRKPDQQHELRHLDLSTKDEYQLDTNFCKPPISPFHSIIPPTSPLTVLLERNQEFEGCREQTEERETRSERQK